MLHEIDKMCIILILISLFVIKVCLLMAGLAPMQS